MKIAHPADALRYLWQLATTPRRFEEFRRALADESQARARDLAWLRREMKLDRPVVALPNPCWTCGATTGQVVATAERSRWTKDRGPYTERVRVVRCATCGICQDAPTEGSEGR